MTFVVAVTKIKSVGNYCFSSSESCKPILCSESIKTHKMLCKCIMLYSFCRKTYFNNVVYYTSV